MRMTWLKAVVIAVALTGCATGGATTGNGPGAAYRDPNLITAAELQKENSPNVYAAIQHLRPEMLRQHTENGSMSINSTMTGSDAYDVHVYLDNTRLGDVSDLKTISVTTIKEIRYLNPTQAMQRFGSGNPGGVIMLTSR
jgi:TonB-dependent Receptor Plug Domain